MNEVQLAILAGLTTAGGGLRYMRLKPEGMGSDKFNYHLQYLVKKGWVEKTGEVYRITQEGKKFTTNLDALGHLQQTFKVSVALYVIKDGQVLLQRRARHPFYGDVTSVAGKILPGERVVAAAGRKLREETGLEASFRLLGMHRKIRRNLEGEVVEDTFYHICRADGASGKLIEKNVYGENFWASFSEAIKYESKNSDFGKTDIKVWERIKKGNDEWFYFEEETVVARY